MIASVSSKHGLSSLPIRIGVGGPVGSGKTALLERLCRCLAASYDIAAITNDIYTSEDAGLPDPPPVCCRPSVSSASRPAVVRTPRFARTPSINLAAVDQITSRPFPGSSSSSWNPAATISPPPFRRSWPILTIYVIDVSAGDKIPRKGGPGVTPLRSPGHQ